MKPDRTPRNAEALEALERQHDLFAYRVDGWSAWRVMRNPVHRLLLALPLAKPPLATSHRVMRALGASARLLWLLAFAGRQQLLVASCRSGLRLPVGEQFRDIYFDGLLQRGYTCLKLESVNSPDFAVQAAKALYPSDLDPVVFTFWGRVLGALLPVNALPFCRFVSALLAQTFDLDVAPKWLLMRVSTVYWQSRLYSALLARVQPRAVMVSDTGEFGLRVASHRRGIRFIELQHGVFDASHPDAVPAWVRGEAAELLLPDFLACGGDYWIDCLQSTRQGREHAVAVGNELIDMARARRQARSERVDFHIVLTTQGLDSERFAEWIRNMIAQAPARRRWRLSIKLHPIYDAGTSVYDSLRADARVRVIGGAEQPNVFDLLADADLHLSISSACHFDAAALGVPSMVVPLAGHELILPACDGRQIILARSPGAVWTHAATAPVDAAGPRRFAEPGFVDNLQRLLQ